MKEIGDTVPLTGEEINTASKDTENGLASSVSPTLTGQEMDPVLTPATEKDSVDKSIFDIPPLEVKKDDSPVSGDERARLGVIGYPISNINKGGKDMHSAETILGLLSLPTDEALVS